MKKTLFAILLLVTGNTAIGQINMADSTVQVITYWDKGEQQNYTVTHEKIRLQETDTILREFTTYDVEVTVLDQTDDSYTIQWLYKNIQTNNTDPRMQKLMSVTEDMKVIYKTDELGTFTEVVNWEEIKNYIEETIGILKKEFEFIPEMAKGLEQIQAMYSTKEAIESASIQDIQQYHSFHGAQYKLLEVLQTQLRIPSFLGPEDFDADIFVYLDEIDMDDNSFVLRSVQEVDEEQLVNATLEYLNKITESMNVNAVLPKLEDLKDLKNEILTASRIHETGWIIYSIMTKTVVLSNTTVIEERIIEIN